MPEDPLDLLVEAAGEDDPDLRAHGYRAALAAVDACADDWDVGHLQAVRARALCGLARDGLVSP